MSKEQYLMNYTKEQIMAKKPAPELGLEKECVAT